MKKMTASLVLVLVCVALALPGVCLADWPKKRMMIRIPWPAGDDPSTMVATARAPLMSDELGVPVKVVK